MEKNQTESLDKKNITTESNNSKDSFIANQAEKKDW